MSVSFCVISHCLFMTSDCSLTQIWFLVALICDWSSFVCSSLVWKEAISLSSLSPSQSSVDHKEFKRCGPFDPYINAKVCTQCCRNNISFLKCSFALLLCWLDVLGFGLLPLAAALEIWGRLLISLAIITSLSSGSLLMFACDLQIVVFDISDTAFTACPPPMLIFPSHVTMLLLQPFFEQGSGINWALDGKCPRKFWLMRPCPLCVPSVSRGVICEFLCGSFSLRGEH